MENEEEKKMPEAGKKRPEERLEIPAKGTKIFWPYDDIEEVAKALAELPTPYEPGFLWSFAGDEAAIFPKKGTPPFEPYFAACTGKPLDMEELAAVAKGWIETRHLDFGDLLLRDIPEEWLNKFGLTRLDKKENKDSEDKGNEGKDKDTP